MGSAILEDIYKKIKNGRKQFAILIDPDKFESDEILELADSENVDYLLIGGSLITNGSLDHTILQIKKKTSIPVILFPGNSFQLSPKADALLLLSLISGRNPEMLIGKHVVAAPLIKASKLETIPTGYILIDGGRPTSVSYISNTNPIPADKESIAMCTAMAGEMLGLKMIYLEAGSGANQPVSAAMVSMVKQNISIPLIVGGGIKDAETAALLCHAGADIIVVGNAIEKNKNLVREISDAIKNVYAV